MYCLEVLLEFLDGVGIVDARDALGLVLESGLDALQPSEPSRAVRVVESAVAGVWATFPWGVGG